MNDLRTVFGTLQAKVNLLEWLLEIAVNPHAVEVKTMQWSINKSPLLGQ